MKRSGRFCVSMIAVFGLLLTGCGKGREELATPPKDIIEVAAAKIPEGQGRLPKRQALSLPEGDVTLQKVAEGSSEVYLYGTTSSNEPRLYVLSKDSLTIEALPYTAADSVVDIAASGDRQLYVLGITEEGKYTIAQPFQGGDSAQILDPDLYADDSIFGLTATAGHFFLKTSRTIVVTDKSGQFIKALGDSSGFAQILCPSPEKYLLIEFGSADPSGARKPTVIDELSTDLSPGKSYQVSLGFSQFFPGSGDTLLARLGGSLYEYDYKTGECAPLMDFSTVSMELMGFTRLDQDRFFSVDKGEACLWTLTERSDYELVTLYTYEKSYDLMMSVYEFNNSQSQVTVQIIEYSDYNTADGQTGMDRLNTDIISGKTPDIYDLSCFGYADLSKNGLLEDLKPFFDADKDFPSSSLVPSAISALEDQGRLYSFVPFFGIVTTVVDSSMIQEPFTFDRLRQLVEENSLRKVLGPEMTRDGLLSYVLYFMADELYSTQEASCSFDSDTFVTILSWMAQLPEEQELFEGNISLPLGSAAVGELMVMIAELGNDPMYILASDAVFPGGASFTGFPSQTGGDFALVPGMELGMSSSSQNKEAVWDFFKFLLTRSPPNTNLGIPIVQAYTEDKVDRTISALGEKTNGLVTMSPQGSVTIPLTAAFDNAEMRERALEILQSINCVARYDQAIYNIIHDQCQAMFAGNASPEATAQQIQSRVSIYLAEQYG